MKLQHIKIMIWLTIAFWTWQLGQQSYSVVYQLSHPEFLNDPKIGDFARRYLVGSSVQMFFFAAAGIISCYVVLLRKSAWAAITLIVLSVYVLWKWEVSPILYFLRPPIGDGSSSKAFSSLNRVYPTFLSWAFEVLKTVFLLLSIPLWLFAHNFLNRIQEDTKHETG